MFKSTRSWITSLTQNRFCAAQHDWLRCACLCVLILASTTAMPLSTAAAEELQTKFINQFLKANIYRHVCSQADPKTSITMIRTPDHAVSFPMIAVSRGKLLLLGQYTEGNGFSPYYWNVMQNAEFASMLPQNLQESDALKDFEIAEDFLDYQGSSDVIFTEYGMWYVGMGRMFWYSKQRKLADAFHSFFHNRYCEDR